MIEEYKKNVEKKLKEYLDAKNFELPPAFPRIIFDAMQYTTLLPAKRLRAILCLETCKMLCGSAENAYAAACAIEMLHAQSLIHDDLPSMDNDDLRRTKPANHKVFGEAIAILAGDALISFGAQTILNSQTPNKEHVLDLYLKSAGALGIVGGQVLDILSEGKKIDFETLQTIHKYKTGSLFECAMLSGALCANAKSSKIRTIKEFAQNFGLVFQIYDDILDEISTTNDIGKTAGKDKLKQKATYVTVFSLNEAKNKLNCLIEKCYDILKKDDIQSSVFNEILSSILKRVNA